MREDRFTNTEHDAALYEARRGQSDDPDDRPTRAEAERDEVVECDSECPCQCEQGDCPCHRIGGLEYA